MAMPAPEPESKVIELDYELQELLLARLNSGSPPAWKLVADACGIFSDHDILKIETGCSPSWELLVELDNKLCTVAILCDLLERCKLFEILALLRNREPIVIVTEPGSSLDSQYEGECITFVPLGGQLRLECHAKGLPPPHFVWFNENSQLQDQHNEILILDNFQLKDEGEYYCCLSQPSIGTESEVLSRRVAVRAQPQPPLLIEQPAEKVRCCEGEVLTLSCVASGHPTPMFQWYHENTLLLMQTSSTLQIQCVQPHHRGDYRCFIQNVAGEVYTRKSSVNVLKYMVVDPKDPVERVKPIEKVALIITNDTYTDFTQLCHPINDAIILAKLLGELDFKVVALQNLTRVEMVNAVKLFCQLLPEGAYGLFYFAGHGFEMQDKFMLPTDAPGPESYLRVHSLCEKEVIRDVLNAKPRLFVCLLDMCLRVPGIEENPNIHGEVPEVFQYQPERNLIQGYATTSNLGAYERNTESNGIYIKHLKEVMLLDKPINKILELVGQSIAKDAKDVAQVQMPSHFENIVENFYLNDRVVGNQKTEIMFRDINQLPADTEIPFTKARVVAEVRFSRKCFQNVLIIRVFNVELWDVECKSGVLSRPQLTISMARESKGNEKYLAITIYNLQTLRIPLTLTISLIDPKSKMLIDNSMLDVGLPLIAPNSLWFNNREEDTLKCNNLPGL